jgi:hypothetical protein
MINVIIVKKNASWRKRGYVSAVVGLYVFYGQWDARCKRLRSAGVEDARISEPFIMFKIFVNKISVNICFRVAFWLNITDT